jgi:hypothetical protein
MKKIQMLVAMGLILAFGCIARAETPAKPASITVVGVTGEARYSTDGKDWHPLVVGKILHEGAVLETAAGSSADLILSGTPVTVPQTMPVPQSGAALGLAPDPNVRGYVTAKAAAQQNVIRMGAGTMLAVDKLTQFDTGLDTVGDTELDLRAGKIFLNVKKMSADSQYIVKLPNGVAGIRGSCGSLGADDSVHWVSGIIILSLIGPDGQPHVIPVRGGFEYNPQTGQISHLSFSVEQALKRFGYDAQTLSALVIPIAPDLTFVFISPNQASAVNTVGTPNNNNNGGVEVAAAGHPL